MSKDDDLLAKAAALAPKPKRKKKAAQALPPGGELPSGPGRRTSTEATASAAKNKGGRPKKSENPETDEKFLEQLQGSLQQTQQEGIEEAEHLAR